MKKAFFAALAILGVVIGSLTMVPAAHAVYAPNGHSNTWQDEPNG